MNKLIVLILLMIVGCTMKAGPVTGPPVSYCKDFRDGETFSFQLENVTNGQIRINGTGCFDVIDDDGLERRLCSEHEAYLKCKAEPFYRGRVK